ncbi:hypothetical protein CfE428DRAFT_1099 [Chthoniobacter flavus Ellin428]|uniref:CNNM transmembrane domain-containing protein n=1 Tax=Chthoniobacter flavus Ellin428 TaxID=497964 RepID=B4CWR1_9BACT|nr:hypothetical protein [Chthoniobacter flavus]EDY21853.1 hypothetical protein CfE428DRAFT_1099 [Chthoniobacter flavus Ellin428]
MTPAFFADAGAIATDWDSPDLIAGKLLGILSIVVLNGFFVATEFALVKVREQPARPAGGGGECKSRAGQVRASRTSMRIFRPRNLA